MEETLTAILISVMAGVLTKFVCNCANVLVNTYANGWAGIKKIRQQRPKRNSSP